MRHSRGRVAAPPPTIRRMTAEALPPGPGPIPFNLLGWTLRPVPFMERCRARYGDRFTVDLGPARGQVDLPHAARRDPRDVLRAGRRPAPRRGRARARVHRRLALGAAARRRRAPRPAQADAARVPWRAHARADGRDGGCRRARGRRLAPGEPFALHTRTQALALEIILRAVFGMSAGARLDALRATLRELLDVGSSPLTLLPVFRRRLGPLTTWSHFLDVVTGPTR